MNFESYNYDLFVRYVYWCNGSIKIMEIINYF